MLVLSCVYFSGYAQSEVSVRDENNQKLAGVHITYKSLNGNYSRTMLTNVEGTALLPSEFIAEHPKFIIELTYVGYMKVSETVSAESNLTFNLNPDKVTLNQVVITAQYAPNSPDKSIQKIKIIDRKSMDARGVVNLTDALQYETNIRISQDNILGSSTSIQGISGENVKIMIDGVPVIGRQDGNIDLNQINMNNIERIEIVEGPLSVNYGTNALAGTINLITKKGQEKKYEIGTNTYYESVGQYNMDARIGYNKGNHQISVAGGRNFFNGWSEGTPFSLIPQSKPADTNRNLQWNPKEQYFINGQYSYSRNENSLRFFTDYFDEEIINRGTPRGPYNETAFDEYFNTTRYSLGTDIRRKISNSLRLNILAAYNGFDRVKTTYFKDLTSLEDVLSSNPDDHDTSHFNNIMSRGSVIHIIQDRPVSWEIGYDVNWEEADGKRISGERQEMGDYALYATLEWTLLQSMIVKPGVRYSYNTAYKAPLIPSLNVKYEINRFTIRASYARGFRAPSLKELYFEFNDVNHNIYGNENLKAETSDNAQFDVGYKLVQKQTITSLSAGVFYNNINDMISLAQLDNGATYSYVNIGNFRSQGIQATIENSHNHLKSSIGFTYTGRRNQVQDSLVAGSMKYSPELRATLMYEFKKLGGNLSAFYKYNGVLPVYTIDETGGVTERTTQDYHMLDITATKYFYNKLLTISIGAKNILDVRNISTTNTVGGIHNSSSGSVPISWGRTYFASIKFNLGWK